MVFTCAGKIFGKPKYSCTSLSKGLSQTFKEKKTTLTASQVLIAKFMDELIKKKKKQNKTEGY